LMCNPQILLMDEPLAALDTPRKAEILPYLERLRDTADVPIGYVSHAISEVTRLANTVVVLRDGHVGAVGPLDDVMSDPQAMALFGGPDAGAILHARVTGYDADDMLTIVTTSAGPVTLRGQVGQIGDALRLRVPAQDIMLSLDPPDRLSALNALPVKIAALAQDAGPSVAVALTAGQDRLLAQISQRSVRALGLEVGKSVFAIFKVRAATPDDAVDVP